MTGKSQLKVLLALEKLGVNLKARKHMAYKYTATGLMPLNIETWREDDGYLTVSICHYGEQNGDLMRDPEVVFKVQGHEVLPLSFRNDYAGVSTIVDNDLKRKDLRKFLNDWASTIFQQGYK